MVAWLSFILLTTVFPPSSVFILLDEACFLLRILLYNDYFPPFVCFNLSLSFLYVGLWRVVRINLAKKSIHTSLTGLSEWKWEWESISLLHMFF